MSVLHDPPASWRIGPAPRAASHSVSNSILPVLSLVKESVTGLGIPGLEVVVGGTLKIFAMIEIMKNNKKDLANLCSEPEVLKTELDKASSSSSAGELIPRLSQTSTQLVTIISRCGDLQKSGKVKRFVQGTHIATQIADIKQSVRDVIQNFVFFGSISIENTVEKMSARLKEFTASVYIDKLVRAPARYDAADTPSKCMDGTRVELLKELMGRVTSSAPSRITIIYGIPGSGKSTIAKTIAIALAKNDFLAGSFFFSRNHANRRELKLVFSTIAFQLAQFNKEYSHLLSEILKNDPDLVNAEPENHLDKLVIGPLSQLPPPTNNKTWVIVLDALDECGSDHGYALLQLLTSYFERFPEYVRFFLTGRPENPILFAFDNAVIKPNAYKYTLDTTSEGAIFDDIRLYVAQSLGDEWPGKEEWKVRDDDLDVLVTRAEGLFIFAATAVKYIQGRAALYDPQKSMESIIRGVGTSDHKPRLLDQLYLKVVQDAIPTGDAAFLAQYQRVLGTVVYLQEPLSAAAIAELLGLEFSSISRIVKLLNSVLSVSEGTVRIAHLSFREFITDPDPKGPHTDIFLRDSDHCHNDLAMSSIDMMNKKLHQNMCGLNIYDTYAPHSDVPNLAELATQNIPPALRYACFYWASHLKVTDNIGQGKVEEWCGTKVLFWLEVLSVCGELSLAIPLITAAQSWYQRNPTRNDFTRYNTLLSDTKRFTAASFDTISMSGGHIYYSALPFAPSSSELSRTYSVLAEQSIRIVKGVDQIWSPLQWTATTGGHVNSVAFSHNGECIASTFERMIELRSSETGTLLSTLEGHTDEANAVAFSRDGIRLASGSYDRTVRIWSLETDQSLLTLKGHTGGVNSVAFSPHKTRLVSGSDDHTIRIWSPETGQSFSTLIGHTDYVHAVTFSPDGTCIASGSNDQTIRIWSETGQSLSILEGHSGPVKAVAFSPDGTHVVSGSSDRTTRIWSSETGQSLSTIEGQNGGVNTVIFSPDGAHVAFDSSGQTIQIWSLETGRLLSTLEGHNNQVNTIAISPDGTRIVSGSNDQTIRVWSSDTGHSLLTEGHTLFVHAITFSLDGTCVASGSYDKMIRIWSLETGESLLTLRGHTGGVSAVAFSPDGTRVASGSLDRTIRIWSSKTGRSLLALAGHRGRVNAVAFSPDGTRIISGSNDRTIRIWSLEAGQSLLTIEGVGHTSWVNAVTWSRDGTRVASSSADQTVRIWSSSTGELFFTRDENGTVEAMALILDGELTQAYSRSTQPFWGPIQFHQRTGWITLSSGAKPVFILPKNHVGATVSGQHGSVLVIGSRNGKVVILDFSRIPQDIMLALSS